MFYAAKDHFFKYPDFSLGGNKFFFMLKTIPNCNVTDNNFFRILHTVFFHRNYKEISINLSKAKIQEINEISIVSVWKIH